MSGFVRGTGNFRPALATLVTYKPWCDMGHDQLQHSSGYGGNLKMLNAHVYHQSPWDYTMGLLPDT